MAEWEPFEAGTVISGKEIATRSEEIAYEINNLGASAIPNKALNREHLPAAYDRSRTKSNTETYTVNSHKFTFPGWPSDNLTGAGWDQAPMVPKTLRYIDADTNTGTNQDAKNRGAREIPEGGSFIPENNGCKGLPRVYKDVSIRSYVRQEDLVRANVGMAVPHQFVEVQLVASVLRNHSPVIFGSPGNVYMDVRETRVSGIIPRFATGAVKAYRLHGRY
jgi:hypothetical protein